MRENRGQMLFIMNEEEDREEESEEGLEEKENETVELKLMEVDGETDIALQNIHGFSEKGTIKLKGRINGRELIMSVDSRASHNFIHQGLVKEPLQTTKGTKFGVTIRRQNGNSRARSM